MRHEDYAYQFARPVEHRDSAARQMMRIFVMFVILCLVALLAMGIYTVGQWIEQGPLDQQTITEEAP